ncbi:MAG TPA: hydroxymethylglutaryl-CoA lyase [Xanthomonadales bacterium]|nr:hydroxymethylglutaryl-CoA lyase [Xanthomonadales bacterium]
MSGTVIINEVGPRDGLQNQPRVLSVAQRVKLIEALLQAGVNHVEAGAFVSPRAVPAMAGSDEVLKHLAGSAAELSVLVPNLKGYELARAAGATSVAMVAYGSEGMAQANVKQSQPEVERATLDMLSRAKGEGIEVSVTISVAFECPFDGPVPPAVVTRLAGVFLDHGASTVVIADTIGAAHPGQVRSLMDALVGTHGADRLACHFHDTRALGLANVFAAVESGIRRFDASIGGLGGCPFAPGASGNVATEDVAMMLAQMGFETGIDMQGLMEASSLAADLTGNAPGGRARAWLERQLAAA